ncbi:uncharacterized protein G2W53_007355 [Senna tora]|uniref:Uncharacterized protein n=1 Tax=Senna tora TaxID=362788 RepID=A0A834X7F1_9FABA|nr:uncharacterized protein G2W53_007355 [Senna tora]
MYTSSMAKMLFVPLLPWQNNEGGILGFPRHKFLFELEILKNQSKDGNVGDGVQEERMRRRNETEEWRGRYVVW